MGLLAGIVAGELLGDINAERFKRGLRRMGGGDKVDQAKAIDPRQLERTVIAALKRNSGTRALTVAAHALGNGILELTGGAPDEHSREQASEIARTVRGVLTVVNRVLVHGVDLPATPVVPRPAT